MYKLHNVYNTGRLSIEIINNDVSLHFDINTFINKRNKEELGSEKQFKLLEEYIEYKGKPFKDRLFLEYSKSYRVMMDMLMAESVTPLPIHGTHNILDLLDYKDILNWVINVRKIPTIKSLIVSFDSKGERMSDSTKEQTYTQSEYLELVALTIITKAILPVVGLLSSVRNTDLKGSRREYTLYNLIRTHKNIVTPALSKLTGFVEKLVEQSNKDIDVTAIRVIEKNIAVGETVTYALSILMLTRIPTHVIENDTEEKHLVNKLYGAVGNVLTNKGDTSNAIRKTKNVLDYDASDGSQMSVLESYNVTTKLPKGWEDEFNFAVSDIDTIISQLPVTVSRDIVDDAYKCTKIFEVKDISDIQTSMLSYIFKGVIDPRSIPYLSLDSLLNLLAVGFGFLWTLDSKYLAVLLISVANTESEGDMSINMTVNRTRLTDDLKNQLQKWYPYNKVINANKTTNLAEEAANKIANNVYTKRWDVVVDDKYVNSIGGHGVFTSLRSDMKILFVELFINLEKVIYEQQNTLRTGVTE